MPTPVPVPAAAARAELVRVALHREGCFGVLKLNGLPLCVTLERAFEEPTSNLLFVKIPAGVYTCKRTTFIRGGYDTFEITGVVGHTGLLFHKGNVEANSEGCVLLGERFSWATGEILESSVAFAEFWTKLGTLESFPLSVSWWPRFAGELET